MFLKVFKTETVSKKLFTKYHTKLNLSFLFQDSTKNGAADENGDADIEFEQNGQNGHIGSPNSDNSRGDKELEELMDVQATAQACIVHALSAVSAPVSQPGVSPPPLAATAPHTVQETEWKTHTRLSPKLRHAPY